MNNRFFFRTEVHLHLLPVAPDLTSPHLTSQLFLHEVSENKVCRYNIRKEERHKIGRGYAIYDQYYTIILKLSRRGHLLVCPLLCFIISYLSFSCIHSSLFLNKESVALSRISRRDTFFLYSRFTKTRTVTFGDPWHSTPVVFFPSSRPYLENIFHRDSILFGSIFARQFRSLQLRLRIFVTTYISNLCKSQQILFVSDGLFR